MSQVDPWAKAAECTRAAEATEDPERRAVLAQLRDLWIALGNDCDSMSADEVAREAEILARLHVQFVNLQQRLLH